MREEPHDVVVLGAGPAGMAAATEAARRGARVLLLDENPQPGGQAHRAAPPGYDVPGDAARRAGDALRAGLAASGAAFRGQHRVWSISGGPPEPFRIEAQPAEGEPVTLRGRALVLCPGAQEHILPFPGWTLPGVMALGAARVMLRTQGVLPGRRVVVAGAGPGAFELAERLLRAGADLAAVADLATPASWRRALPALLGRPGLPARLLAWRARLAARGVPVLRGAEVVAAEGGDAVERVRLRGAGGEAESFDCDALCVTHGLLPEIAATRLVGATHRHDRREGGWVPVLDADRRSSRPLVYVAGDGAGVRGAAAAVPAGRLAALAALADLGILSGRAHARARWRPWIEQWRAARRGAALARLATAPPGLAAAIAPEAVVCRCEGVTRAAIEAALDDGAASLGQLARFTGCGLGACQGRLCGEAAAELVARRVGGRAHAGLAPAGVPLRPVPVDALLGAAGRGRP